MTIDQLEALLKSCKNADIPGDAIVSVELEETEFPDLTEMYIKDFVKYEREERWDGSKNVLILRGVGRHEDL